VHTEADLGTRLRHRFDDLMDLLQDRQRLELVMECTGVEASRGEQVVDHAGEIMGLADDHAHHLLGRRILDDDRILLQEVGEAEDRSERRPQLVGSIGHELIASLTQVLLGLQANLELGLPLLALRQLSVHHDDGGRHQERHQEPDDVTDTAHQVVGRRHLGGLEVPLDHHSSDEGPEIRIERLSCIAGRLGLTLLEVPKDRDHRAQELGPGRLDLGGQPPGQLIEILETGLEVAQRQPHVICRQIDGGPRIEVELALQEQEMGGQPGLGPGHRGGPQDLVGVVEGVGVLGHSPRPVGDREHQGEDEDEPDAHPERQRRHPGTTAGGATGAASLA
jgi:hypothetical protein